MKSTKELMEMLDKDPEKFKSQLDRKDNAPVFSEYLTYLMDEMGCSGMVLMNHVFISKTYYYQLRSGERLPGRNTAIRIALVLSLSVDETQRLLTLAEKNVLYPKVRRDAAILLCIKKKKSFDETENYLKQIGEESLL